MNKFLNLKLLKEKVIAAFKNGKRIYSVDKPCSTLLMKFAVSIGAYLRIIKAEPETVFETDAACEKILADKLVSLGFTPRRKRGVAGSYKKRYGIFFGIVIFAVLMFSLSQIIWSIEIEGNKRLSEEEVLSLLESCEVSEGMWNRKIDSDRTRILMMNRSRDIAWVSVNVSGMIARVQISETTLKDNAESTEQYANIVASKDGVITDITVECGKPMVAVGDTVKKGELLISGIIEERDGDMSLVNAKGTVLARTEQTVEVTKSLTEQIKEKKGEKLKKISVNLFGKSINFSVNGGLNGDNCDIITKKGSFALFGGFRLPVDYKTIYQAEVNAYFRNITHDTARRLCEQEAYDALLSSGAELIARKISVENADDSVTLRLFAVCEENIGLAMPFTAEP